MDTSECYRTVRARMIELAATLSEEQAATPVPALPAWTVRDTYAHLAGLCAEVLDGVVAGPATDEDTAREVSDRSGRTFAEVCTEWAARAPEIDALTAAPKGYRYNLLVQDAWHHEQDVLGALGLPQMRYCPTTPTIAATTMDRYARAWQKFELSPAVRIETPNGAWEIGVGEPAAALRTNDFDLVRMLIGRRTLDEMRKMDWTGDPGEALDRLHFLPNPVATLGE
jgi:uncharacterized protein (TIGR03083 family)